MQEYQIDAWLGEVDLTPDQRERFTTAITQVEAAYSADDSAEATAALSAALQYILGEVTLADAGAALDRGRTAQNAAAAAAKQLAIIAIEDGVPETRVAEALGVTRRTVRQWQGKTH